MIQIYYAYTGMLRSGSLDPVIRQLSLRTKAKLSLLRRDEDQRLLLTSLVLLSKALRENGFDDFGLDALQYGPTGRPFFSDSSFDFNISHTENCAAVVFSKDCRVGIDVESIKEVDFSDFTDCFQHGVWKDIYSAEDKFGRFYYYWTLLESGIKADGRGVSLLDTKSVELTDGDLFIDNVKWFYSHFDFDQSISCCVTADRQIQSHRLNQITSV